MDPMMSDPRVALTLARDHQAHIRASIHRRMARRQAVDQNGTDNSRISGALWARVVSAASSPGAAIPDVTARLPHW